MWNVKKSYDDICVTITIEIPRKIKDETRKTAVEVLKDDLINLLNDRELACLIPFIIAEQPVILQKQEFFINK